MKKLARIISLLLVLCLMTGVISIVAACKPKNNGDGGDTDGPTGGVVYNDFKVGGRVIIGSSTDLTGDFRFTGVDGNPAASDRDINNLTAAYSTMELNKNGSYVWNNTVVKSHNEEEVEKDDGSVTYLVTIEINSGLKMSGGTEITAANYLAYTLALASPVGAEWLDDPSSGYSIWGWPEYSVYDGTNDGQEAVNDYEGPVTASKVFAGLRLLGTYKFSIEVREYPWYFANTYGSVSPYDLKLVLGEGVTVKDDGQGAYLEGNWYEKDDSGYKKVSHLEESRWDTSKYEFTGAYTISNWNESSLEATLTINPNFAGNFEGQKPHVQTIVYRKVIEATQFGQLDAGEIDILAGLTGGDSVGQALSRVNAANSKFSEVHYDRAGYGKVQFDCDFSPTMFAEVRQAVAYALDRQAFVNQFCGGYGALVNAPYSVNFDAYLANEDYLEEKLINYTVNLTKAAQLLEQGGWIYNSDGSTPFDASKGTGVRYKKLSASEYGVNDFNKTFEAVSNTDGKTYKTVQIGDDFYMPLVINWMASENNPVSELLATMLLEGTALSSIGMKLTQTVVPFGTLTATIYRRGAAYTQPGKYTMYNLATGWNSELYDYSYTWIPDGSGNEEAQYFHDAYLAYGNKLTDPLDLKFLWWNEANQGLSFEQAAAKAGGADKLGMDYLSMAMVYSVEPGDKVEYNKWFAQYLIRWNQLLPEIPLYGNIYYDIYNSDILNFKTTPFFGAADALLYCGISSAQ